jgi:hypothetical protein
LPLPALKLGAVQQAEASGRINAGDSMVDIGKSYNVSHATMSRAGGQGGPAEAV